MPDESVEDAVLNALAALDDGEPESALARLVALSAEHPGHSDLADAWAALGDSGAARGEFGLVLLTAMVPIARSWPEARGRSTMMMALAELDPETEHEPALQEFIDKLLSKNPDERPSCEEALIWLREKGLISVF